MLLAPIGILKWLIRKDFIYIIGMKEIEFVTKDLIRALTYLNEHKGTISCYQADDTSNRGELWWGEVWTYNKHEDIDCSIERLITDISNYEII